MESSEAARKGVPADQRAPADRLDSWKEIAAHLKRGERTVRRWEQTEGLPVHRHPHQKRATVFAFAGELDSWWNNRGIHLVEHESPRAPIRARPIWRIAVAAAVVASAIASIAIWRSAFSFESYPRAVPMTSFPGMELFPTFSPDGSQIAFSRKQDGEGDSNLFVQQVGSAGVLRLTNHPANDWSPAWSPDGRSIAFLRWTSGKAAVLVVPSLPGSEREITQLSYVPRRGPFYGGHLAWSPDGKWLAVVDREAPGQPPGIFLVPSAGGEKRRLTLPPDPAQLDIAPAFSPDSKALVFIRVLGFGVSELFYLDLKADLTPAGDPQPITSDRRFTSSPVWTPDGRDVIFSSGELWSGRALWRVSPHARFLRSARRLAVLAEYSSLFAISRVRDGTYRLAYVDHLFDPNIWRLELVGGDAPVRAHVLIGSTRTDLNPQFSPDATRIAFVSNRSGNEEVWLCDSDGSDPIQMTSGGGQAPRWSPDGQWIAFSSNREGHRDIYLIRSGGGEPRRLTTDPGNDSDPSWSRDGKWIYFSSSQTGEPQVWKTPGNSPGTPVQVTRKGGSSAFESHDGRLLYYTKAAGLWSVPVDGGEERPVLDSIYMSTFAVARDGIYFIPRSNPAAAGSIQFFRFSSGKVSKVLDLDKPAFVGMSISPDNQSLLFSQVDREESDLMLIEGIR